MKKLKKVLLPLTCLCTVTLLTSCRSADNNTEFTSDTASLMSLQTSIKEEISESPSISSLDESENSAAITEETSAVSDESQILPENVVLSDPWGKFSITDDNPDHVSYDKNGIWQTATFDNLVYASLPGETEFKKYAAGDKMGDFTVKSCGMSFMNLYLDNDFHDGYRLNSSASLEETSVLIGTLTIAEEEEPCLVNRKNDILFTPDQEEESILARLGGMADEEKYYDFSCGNKDDDNLKADFSEIPPGESVRVKITVSDIILSAEVGVPVTGRINCKIESLEML